MTCATKGEVQQLVADLQAVGWPVEAQALVVMLATRGTRQGLALACREVARSAKVRRLRRLIKQERRSVVRMTRRQAFDLAQRHQSNVDTMRRELERLEAE